MDDKSLYSCKHPENAARMSKSNRIAYLNFLEAKYGNLTSKKHYIDVIYKKLNRLPSN